MLLLLILLAKGLTLVRRKISGLGRIKIACFMSLYLGASVILEGWKIYGYDEVKGAMPSTSTASSFYRLNHHPGITVTVTLTLTITLTITLTLGGGGVRLPVAPWFGVDRTQDFCTHMVLGEFGHS